MAISSGFLESVGDWLYSFASALGGPGLLVIAIADSSFLSIPEGNDLLIVVLSIGKSWGEMAYYVLMTVMGSVIGCLLLYAVGRHGGRALLEKKFSPKRAQVAQNYLQKYGILSIMIPSILPPPMPFKIFVLTAGVFGLTPGRFMVAVVLGRSIRYFMWGILTVLYGKPVRNFIVENLPTVGIAALGIILVSVVLVVTWQMLRRKKFSAGI